MVSYPVAPTFPSYMQGSWNDITFPGPTPSPPPKTSQGPHMLKDRVARALHFPDWTVLLVQSRLPPSGQQRNSILKPSQRRQRNGFRSRLELVVLSLGQVVTKQ